MFDVQLTDSDTGADLTFGAHQVHLLAQVIKELPFSIRVYDSISTMKHKNMNNNMES